MNEELCLDSIVACLPVSKFLATCLAWLANVLAWVENINGFPIRYAVVVTSMTKQSVARRFPSRFQMENLLNQNSFPNYLKLRTGPLLLLKKWHLKMSWPPQCLVSGSRIATWSCSSQRLTPSATPYLAPTSLSSSISSPFHQSRRRKNQWTYTRSTACLLRSICVCRWEVGLNPCLLEPSVVDVGDSHLVLFRIPCTGYGPRWSTFV